MALFDKQPKSLDQILESFTKVETELTTFCDTTQDEIDDLEDKLLEKRSDLGHASKVLKKLTDLLS